MENMLSCTLAYIHECLLQYWEWDQHGVSVPLKKWEWKLAMRFTTWASEVLSGPLASEELLTTIATR